MSRSTSEGSDQEPVEKTKAIEDDLRKLEEQIKEHKNREDYAKRKISEQSRRNTRGTGRRRGGGYGGGHGRGGYRNTGPKFEGPRRSGGGQRSYGQKDGNYNRGRRNNFRDYERNGEDNRAGGRERGGRRGGGTIDRYGRRKDASRSRSAEGRGSERGRDRYGRPAEKFFGLAQGSGGTSKPDFKVEDYDRRSSDEESEDEEPEVPKMISLVAMSSDHESEEEGEVEPKKETKTEDIETEDRGRRTHNNSDRSSDRKRKYQSRNQERKRRRVNIINKMKSDTKHQDRSRRLFSFMKRHLGRAKKEIQQKEDIQNSFATKAKNILQEQRIQVNKDYEEKQKEKYKARVEHEKKQVELIIWRMKHKENLLHVDGLKTHFTSRLKLIDDGNIITSTSPPICWQPKAPESQEDGETMSEDGSEEKNKTEDKGKFSAIEDLMSKLKKTSRENLQSNLDLSIQAIIDDEGEEPEEPEPLPREFQTSPRRDFSSRARENDDRGGENKNRFGKNRGDSSNFRSRRRSRERPRKNITTNSLRNRSKVAKEKEEPPVTKTEPVMMSLISVPEE